jgi:hypothetical protein
MAAMREELRGEIVTLRGELLERMHDTETRLLKAFYNFAESNQKRPEANEATTASVVNRLGTIERRVTEIEKRLNMPQAS